MEEEHWQAIWRRRWLHDLLLCTTQYKLPAAKDGLQNLQKEIPLRLSGELSKST